MNRGTQTYQNLLVESVAFNEWFTLRPAALWCESSAPVYPISVEFLLKSGFTSVRQNRRFQALPLSNGNFSFRLQNYLSTDVHLLRTGAVFLVTCTIHTNLRISSYGKLLNLLAMCNRKGIYSADDYFRPCVSILMKSRKSHPICACCIYIIQTTWFYIITIYGRKGMQTLRAHPEVKGVNSLCFHY